MSDKMEAIQKTQLVAEKVLQRMDSEIARLVNVVQELNSRLIPICNPMEDADNQPSNEVVDMPVYFAALNRRSDSLRSQTEMLNIMLDNLEI